MKHTPGPWTVNPRKLGTVEATDEFGTDVIATMGGSTSGHPVANARLISAAPDMLEALEEAGAYVGTALGTEGDEEATRIFGIIYAAVAKATGRGLG